MVEVSIIVLEDSQFLGNIPQIFWKIFDFRGIFPKYLGQFPILGEYSPKICGGSFHNSFGRFPIFRKYSPNILKNFQFYGNITQKYMAEVSIIVLEDSQVLGNIPQIFWKIPNSLVNIPQIFWKIPNFLVNIPQIFRKSPNFGEYSPNILENFRF